LNHHFFLPIYCESIILFYFVWMTMLVEPLILIEQNISNAKGNKYIWLNFFIFNFSITNIFIEFLKQKKKTLYAGCPADPRVGPYTGRGREISPCLLRETDQIRDRPMQNESVHIVIPPWCSLIYMGVVHFTSMVVSSCTRNFYFLHSHNIMQRQK